MKTPLNITYFAKHDHRILNGYCHPIYPSPVVHKAKRCWKKQIKSFFVVAKSVDRAIVEFDNGEKVTIYNNDTN